MNKAYNLSIIIPHFNMYITLEKLLKSIPDKEDIQIIVVDDQSEQGMIPVQEYIQKNSRTNIEVLLNEKGKKGAGTCRNIGLSRATGIFPFYIKNVTVQNPCARLSSPTGMRPSSGQDSRAQGF